MNASKNANNVSISLKEFYSRIINRSITMIPIVFKLDNSYLEGSYPEGLNYYNFAVGYLNYFLATLENTLGSYYTLLNFEDNYNINKTLLNNIVLNPVYLSGSTGLILNTGDCGKNITAKEDSLFYLANVITKRTNNGTIFKLLTDYRKRTDKAWEFYSILWYNGKYDSNSVDYQKIFDTNIYSNSVIQSNLNKIGTVAFRSNYTDSKATFFAINGTNVNRIHRHLDIGSYVFDALETRWIIDPGSQNAVNGGYPTNASDRKCYRWQYYKTRAEAHSTIVLNKPKTWSYSGYNCLELDQWINAKGTFEKFISSANSSLTILNMSDAYNKNENHNSNSSMNSNKIRRGVKTFNNKKYILVQDEIKVNKVNKYYSMLNVNNDEVVDVIIQSDRKSAILKDKSGNKLYLLLKTIGNYDFKFYNIYELDENNNGKDTGLLNSIIYANDNGKVQLSLNKNNTNPKKLVIYLNNTSSKIDAEVGVLFVPIAKENIENDNNFDTLFINSIGNNFKLDNLSKWKNTPNEIQIPTINTNIAVTSISLNKTNTTIVVGNNETLLAKVNPQTATNKSVTWTSSNTKIATVDNNGKVTGISTGTVTITAKTNNGKIAICNVTVIYKSSSNNNDNSTNNENNSNNNVINSNNENSNGEKNVYSVDDTPVIVVTIISILFCLYLGVTIIMKKINNHVKM